MMMLLQHRGAEKLELARWTVVLGSTGMYVRADSQVTVERTVMDQIRNHFFFFFFFFFAAAAIICIVIIPASLLALRTHFAGTVSYSS